MELVVRLQRQLRRRRPMARRWSSIACRSPAPNEIYSAPLHYPDNVAWRFRRNAYSVPEIACFRKRSRSPQLNDPVLSQIQMQPLEPFWFTGAAERESPGLRRQAAQLRSQQEVSREVPHPRRPAGRVGRRLVVSLESRALRRQRLRRGDGQLPRLNRLRPEVHRRHQRQLGRRRRTTT